MANISAFTFLEIDLAENGNVPLIIAKQGDSGRAFRIALYSDGEELDLGGTISQIYIRKPDGNVVYQQFTVYQNRLIITLNNQALTTVGLCEVEIVTTGGNTKVSTPIFILKVLKTNVDESAIESQNDFSALQEAVSTISQYDKRIFDNETNIAKNVNDITALDQKMELAHASMVNEYRPAIADLKNKQTEDETNISRLLHKTVVNSLPYPWLFKNMQESLPPLRYYVPHYHVADGYYGFNLIKESGEVSLTDTFDIPVMATTSTDKFANGVYTLSGMPENNKGWVRLDCTLTHKNGSTTHAVDTGGGGTTFTIDDNVSTISVNLTIDHRYIGNSAFDSGTIRPMIALSYGRKLNYVGYINGASTSPNNCYAAEFYAINNKIQQLQDSVSELRQDLSEVNRNLMTTIGRVVALEHKIG